MNAMLSLQFTLFALVGIGFYVRRSDMVSEEGQKNLTDLVMNVILPCNIVTSFLNDVDRSALHDLAAVFLISLGIQSFCLLFGKLAYRRADREKQRCLRYGAMVSNAGFLGNPVAQGLFGDYGLMLAGIYLTPLRLVMWSEGIAIFSGISSPKAALKKVATHPCVVSCMIGLAIMVVRLFAGVNILPAFLFNLIQTIGRANTAMSMLVVGMIVSRVRPADFMDALVFRFSIERLVLIPAVIGLALVPFRMAGMISQTVLGLCVILAAMPAATTTGMLAVKYDCAPEFAAKMVVVSTVLSIPTIFVWSLILTI